MKIWVLPLPARWAVVVKTAKMTRTVQEEANRLEIDVAEAGSTRRSDGELVGQFISSCRLSAGRVRRRFEAPKTKNSHFNEKKNSQKEGEGERVRESLGGSERG